MDYHKSSLKQAAEFNFFNCNSLRTLSNRTTVHIRLLNVYCSISRLSVQTSDWYTNVYTYITKFDATQYKFEH